MIDGREGVTPASGGRPDEITVHFLAQGEQTGQQIAGLLVDFIAGARQSLDVAVYDFRLSPPLLTAVTEALRERANAGVAIRFAYDADKPATPNLILGQDPAPPGTGALIQSLGYPYRRIGGMKLMHSKYICRDAGLPSAAVWTGSTNFTDDAWTLMENNIITLASQPLAAAYALDFAQLWAVGHIEGTGNFEPNPQELWYRGEPARVQALFSPGQGATIDEDVAGVVASAERRVRICSMLLNSGSLLSALRDLLDEGRVPVDGVYDRTQMESVLLQWRDVPHNHWKIGALRDIVERARLVGKVSTPYSPTGPHDFMHDKALVVDDTVITGSYNFSRSAEFNAENILLIESPALADAYSAMIDHLIAKYGAQR
jgi:phosphatidylserine/phosphatidylglycerophosphate/cardiolipin synthase-like enzyme